MKLSDLEKMDALVLEAREGEKRAVAEVSDLRAEVARLTAELADAALDSAELARIRPHRGDPYFYCTIEQWGDEVRQNVEHGQRIEALTAELATRTEERDGLAAALDEYGDHNVPCPKRGGDPENPCSCGFEKVQGNAIALLAAHDAAVRKPMEDERDAARVEAVDAQGHFELAYKQAKQFHDQRDALAIYAMYIEEAALVYTDGGIVNGFKGCRETGFRSWRELTASDATNPAAILAAVKARAKADGMREAADQLTPVVPSPIGPLHAAGMMFCVEHLRKMAAQVEAGKPGKEGEPK